MVDTLATLEEKSPVNSYLTILYALPVMVLGVISVTGFQQTNLALLAIGLTFVPLALFSEWLSDGHIFRSKASWGLLSFSFSFPIIVLQLANITTGFKFSSYSSASEGYLSSILGSAPPPIEAVVNVIIAPILETAVFLAIALLLYRSLRLYFKRSSLFAGIPYTSQKLLAAIIAVQPSAYGFSQLHGPRGFIFKVIAYIIMNIMLIPGLLEDQTSRTIVPWLGLGGAFISGLHIALNLNSLDDVNGLLGFFGLIREASGPIAVANDAVILFILVSILSGAAYAWSKTGGKFVSIKKQIIKILKTGFSLLPI